MKSLSQQKSWNKENDWNINEGARLHRLDDNRDTEEVEEAEVIEVEEEEVIEVVEAEVIEVEVMQVLLDEHLPLQDGGEDITVAVEVATLQAEHVQPKNLSNGDCVIQCWNEYIQ